MNRLSALAGLLVVHVALVGANFENPRVGIVISSTTYEQTWGVTQMAAHGWTAISHLAGLPYDNLFIEDLPDAKTLSGYEVLILAQCTFLGKKDYAELINALKKYLDGGGNIIIDGPLATANAKARERKHAQLDDLLGINYGGFQGGSDYRIQVTENTHPVTRQFEVGQNITQHLVSGLNIMNFQKSGTVLLGMTDEEEDYPFLSIRDDGTNRVVLVSDFSTWSGVASFFRNQQPRVFYQNRIFEVLIETLQWAVYGEQSVPIPVPQLSNANLTPIIRLDADGSDNLDAQVRTLNYLTDIARESGVVSVYAWVSDGVAKAGWQDVAPLGKRLEEYGGQIGTHSKYHRIDQKMNEKRWREELDESIHDIEWNMQDFGYPIGKVTYFINPGNTIRMGDYEQVARRFSFYMTHGFEQDMPLGFGNMTWFTGEHKEMVVIENSPSPDYQWFYDPEWSYTTAQITAYEEAVIDHMFNNIGRGVIFNQMWHDYSITTQPQRDKDRIVNSSNIAMYDAVSAKFATLPIYAPTPDDLAHKLRAMATWNYQWSSTADEVQITIDLEAVHSDTTANFIGGMGLRLDDATSPIRMVTINGQPHDAFTEDLVILPNLNKGKNNIIIQLGQKPIDTPRLTYVSKRMPWISRKSDGLSVQLLTRNKARFAFVALPGNIVVGADWQEYGRKQPNELTGYVTSDRVVTLKSLDVDDFSIVRLTVPLNDCTNTAKGPVFVMGSGGSTPGQFVFKSGRRPTKILLADSGLTWSQRGNQYTVDLPEISREIRLTIEF